jgi:RNA 2',3'-cyclic 3'-phosphodiesterase
MRLFTALDIPGEITARLRAFVDRLRSSAKLAWSPLAWSPMENLHVTTKFIGEWPEPRFQEIKDALATVPPPGPIEIAVRGVGWFPNARNPIVFWAGVESGPALQTLARDTEGAVATLGVPVEDREFHPHLTLARGRDAARLEKLRELLAAADSTDFGAFPATSFFLYQSAGGRYTRLNEFPLTRI